MILVRTMPALAVMGALVASCAPVEKPLSPVAQRLAEKDVLGSVLSAMLISKHVANLCDGYTYDNGLAFVDMDNAERVMSREAYSPEDVESGKRELSAIATADLEKDIAAGKYAPAERYCPTLENADVQQQLLGLRYLKKVR